MCVADWLCRGEVGWYGRGTARSGEAGWTRGVAGRAGVDGLGMESVAVRSCVCRGWSESQPTPRSGTVSPRCAGCASPSRRLLELLASGMSIEGVIEDHPDLERDDLLAALEFGALVSGQCRVVPFGAA
jgi:uncharacterized protein (DUF433 family)